MCVCVGGGGGGSASLKVPNYCPWFSVLSAPHSPLNAPYSRGGGHSGTGWIPTAKQPHRLEAVNPKIYFQGKKVGRSTSN